MSKHHRTPRVQIRRQHKRNHCKDHAPDAGERMPNAEAYENQAIPAPLYSSAHATTEDVAPIEHPEESTQ